MKYLIIIEPQKILIVYALLPDFVYMHSLSLSFYNIIILSSLSSNTYIFIS